MTINLQDINVTDEMLCNFVDGKTTPEQDNAIFARMKVDSEFAAEVRDLMDAMDTIANIEQVDLVGEEYPYTTAAFASFAEQDTNEKKHTFFSSLKSMDEFADHFLDEYEENEDENSNS